MKKFFPCLPAFFLMFFWHASVLAQSDVACLLSCFKEKSCEVRTDKAVPLSGDTYTFEKSCLKASVVSGKVLVRYKRAGAWFSPSELPKVNESLDSIFKNFPPDSCSVPTPQCLQSRLGTKVAGVAGHGIDSQESLPAGVNEPCRRGLPCGLVLAPTKADWSFPLNEAADGQWQVRLLRGEPRPNGMREWSAPVQAGTVVAEGQRFDAGRVYAYRLVDRSGSMIASGEFETVSAKRLEILQRLTQRRVSEGMSERAAWIDTMLNAELDWDAFRSISGN